MSIEAHKQVVRDYVLAFNAFDIARMRELFTEDAKIWGVLGAGPFDVVEPIWKELHEGLQMFLEIVEMAADGDHVAVRFRESGRFVAPCARAMPELEPTDRPYAVTAMEWFRFRDGRIAERWGARDSATIRRQVTGG